MLGQRSRIDAIAVRRLLSKSLMGVTVLDGGPYTVLRPSKNCFEAC